MRHFSSMLFVYCSKIDSTNSALSLLYKTVDNFELVVDYRMHTVVEVVDMAFRCRHWRRRRTDTQAMVVRRAMEFVDMVESLVFVAFVWEKRADCAIVAVDCSLGCRIYCADRVEVRECYSC